MKYFFVLFFVIPAMQGCGDTYPPTITTTATPTLPMTCPELSEVIECKCHAYKQRKCVYFQCTYKDVD